MDNRILPVAEKLARDMFHLNPHYESISCNIKPSTVDLVMSNGLVPITVKFPRELIESNIEVLSSIAQHSKVEEDDAPETQEQPLNDTPEEETKKSNKKIIRRKK